MAKKYTLSVNEQKIVDSVTIPQYFNEHILPYKVGFRPLSAERPSTICPFHDDTDPSFHYWREKAAYHCFGCGVSGNVISLHMRWQKQQYNRVINVNTAVKELAELYGIQLELDESGEAKVESIFEIARKKNALNQYKANPYDGMTIAGFRTFNTQIKNSIARRQFITGEQAAKLYHSLDMRLSAYLADKKEGSGS